MQRLARPVDFADDAPKRQWQKGDEPIAGYVLESPLGKGGFGEVWRSTAPGGFPKAVKIIQGSQAENDPGIHAFQERKALELLRDIRHPFILTVERVEEAHGCLLVVMELADRNLHDLFVEYKAQGKAGIPREELLAYLREAAEALDLMNFQHGLQHLDVKPQNLFLVSNHCKVADFGLVKRHSGGAGGKSQAPSGVTPRYVAPEVLENHISRRSDQYSLAIVYQELLTGEPPFKGRTGRQLFVQHMSAAPDVNSLATQDRSLVARALSKEPDARFGSCSDLIRLLQAAPRTMGAAAATAAPVSAEGGAGLTVSLSGCQYQGRLGQTPLGELWQVRLPSGEDKLAYHLQGFTLEDAAQQAQALHLLRDLRHPALLRFEIAELSPARIILLFDLFGSSLADRLRAKTLTHDELLRDIEETARHVDDLLGSANLYHLALNPESILRGLDSIKLRDFGLVPLLWQSEQQPLDGLNPRYAAPECARGRPGPTSDQYSLARAYTDLRVRLLAGGNPAQVRAKKGASEVDLTAMPAPERVVVARALDHQPDKRFASCTALIECLAASLSDSDEQSTATVRNIASAAQSGFLQTLAEWVQSHPGAGRASKPADETLILLKDGRVAHTCTIDVLPATVKLHLEIFRQEWNASGPQERDGALVFFVGMKQTFWQKLVGKTVGIEVTVDIKPLAKPKGNRAEATFVFSPVNCRPTLEDEVRKNMAPDMLRTLRQCLNASPERRSETRLPFPYEVTVRQRPAGQAPTENRCQGINLSQRGIGFISPAALEKGEARVLFSLPKPEGDGTSVFLKAVVTRCRPLPGGEFEVGAEFVREKREPAKAEQESGS